MHDVSYFPPGREDIHVFACKDEPRFTLSEQSGLHSLMVEFSPINGPMQGKLVTVPAAHCLVEIHEHA